MSRPVVLSNGSLFVGLNEHGLVHDFYYPYVGLENLTTARSVHHKVGVQVNGVFSWLDDGTWDMSVDFEDDALISKILARSSRLGVTLYFRDFVGHESNVFARKIRVINDSQEHKSIKVFMHQVFQISRAGREDTALFVPEENYILDYKGHISLIIYGRHQNGQPFDQFAIGNYAIEGKEGTFKDAEDGNLEGCPVEHGGVDSVIRFSLELTGGNEEKLEYWVIASDSQSNAVKTHKIVLHVGLDRLLEATKSSWINWLSTGANKIHGVDKKYLSPIKKSLLLIKAHTDQHGGVLASGDSSIYNYGRDYYSYVWPRDGAYAMWPLIRLGYRDEPRKFFEFCRDILQPDGYLMHKYQPDQAVGSTWHPLVHNNHTELAIQEDESAIVLYMLGEYYAHSKDDEFVESMYDVLVKPIADFLVSFRDSSTNLPHPSYDLWEERFLTHTYTTAITYQALLVASELAEVFSYPEDQVRWKNTADELLGNMDVFKHPDGYLRKGFILDKNNNLQFDDTLDTSSLYGSMMFGYHEKGSDILKSTVELLELQLASKVPIGGFPRYTNDSYFRAKADYPGNPWFVTTLWLAQYYLRVKNVDRAVELIDWTLKYALPSGVLSEQVDPENGDIISVAPLVWSQAELINTILDASHLQ